MFKHLKNEIWKPLTVKGYDKLYRKCMISSLGRVTIYTKNFETDGVLLQFAKKKAAPSFIIKINDKIVRLYLHRVVAQIFVKPNNKIQTNVIHLNHNKLDNKASNLQWATKKEVTAHNYNGDGMQNSFKNMAQKCIDAKKGKKLKLSEVIQIKKILANPKRKLTYLHIAEKYGVSEKAISRIKSGENWSLVKI